MRFADLVETSTAVTRSSSRLDKIEHLARAIRQLADTPDEIEAGLAFLSGTPRQGRIGLGYAAVQRAADVAAADDSTLHIGDVDAALADVAAASGAGSARHRGERLRDLLARATVAEQDFVRRLLFGELRQGALEGVLADAVARASGIAPAHLRRAAMMSGSLISVARAALTGGEAALSAVSLRVMQPVQPMLADSAEDVDAALHQLDAAALEYKFDGARIQVHKADDVIRVFSRTLNDVTASVPEVVSRVRSLPARSLILDGEVIALTDNGRPHSFQTTMRRFGRTRGVDALRRDLPLTPFFFDCLLVDDAALLDESQQRRVLALHDIAPDLGIPRVVRPTPAQASAFVSEALGKGHEGIVAKDLNAPYAAGRRGSAWLKVKPAQTLDLVVLAAEWGHGRRRGWLSNLHLGAREPGHEGFVMLGKTFKGLTDEMLEWQTAHLLTLETGRDEHAVYVRPSLVVEIAFNDLQISPTYPGGLALRFARVKRYRMDKTARDADSHRFGPDAGGLTAAGGDPMMPAEARYEHVHASGRDIAISNPDKVLFPDAGITKLDLVRYYLSVADGALRAAGGRPNVLVRHPNGVGEEFFYQKRAPSVRPEWIDVVTITFPSGRTADEVVPREAAALAWMANLACLELHPHPVRADDLDHPDELRVDLDPGPGVAWTQVQAVAEIVRATLRDSGLIGWPKTSGSRGMHIYVRIARAWTFRDVRRAALALAREVERRAPALATSKWWKEERHGVFVDYNQNAKDRTIAAAYSVRPSRDARVSAPLDWTEVADCNPADFTLRTMPDRFSTRGDLHAAMDSDMGSLASLLELSARQEREGLGDAPWPPHYRKQSGEPTRVQPSRKRSATSSSAAAAAAAPAPGESRSTPPSAEGATPVPRRRPSRARKAP